MGMGGNNVKFNVKINQTDKGISDNISKLKWSRARIQVTSEQKLLLEREKKNCKQILSTSLSRWCGIRQVGNYLMCSVGLKRSKHTEPLSRNQASDDRRKAEESREPVRAKRTPRASLNWGCHQKLILQIKYAAVLLPSR